MVPDAVLEDDEAGNEMKERMLVLDREELTLLLKLLSKRILHMKTPDTDKGVFEKMRLQNIVAKVKDALNKNVPHDFTPFYKQLEGFESLNDIDDSLRWWLNDHSGLEGEFQGTLTMRIEYEEG